MAEFEKKLLIDRVENDAEQDAIIKDFINMYGSSTSSQTTENEANYKTVHPKPEFCIKSKAEDGSKVFLNLCTADHIPTPKDISDAELLALLDSDDPTGYRVPMSLGEPHAEIDKSGHGCTAYDIVISDQFCAKIKSNDLFMGFFMSVIMEGIDNKYNVRLSRDWIKLKNKRCMGKVLPQYIRNSSKPLIMEMDGSASTSGNTSRTTSREEARTESLITEVSSTKSVPAVRKAVEPKYRIVQEPVTGHPEYLIAEIELPEVKTCQALTLDVGEDCIILNSRSKIYYLEVYLPYNLVQRDSGAQFNKENRVLTLTLPVQPQT